MQTKIGTRFSGADWATELRTVSLIGLGGIGSWLALNLGRIGHEIVLYDGDTIDETNVLGGQMYQMDQLGTNKAQGVRNLCASMGCNNTWHLMRRMFDDKDIPELITITGLDNMAARKLAYERWLYTISQEPENADQAIFMDGRLNLEMMEIITLQGNNPDHIREYREKYLFDDKEVEDIECTVKQSTFAAMGIACLMTATLCNWLTNKKLGMDFREVPMYQRLILPICNYKTEEYGSGKEERREATVLPVEEPRVFQAAVDTAV